MIRSGLIMMIKDFAAKGKRAGEISHDKRMNAPIPLSGSICFFKTTRPLPNTGLGAG